jgi:DNA repair ATPase RecN
MFGGCYQNFRNTPNPVFVKVTYKNNQLSLATDIDNGGKKYLPCFSANDISLPTGYYFGFSASSTQPADDHDLLSFDLYDLNPSDYEKEESESVSTEDGEATAAELRKKMEEIKSHLDKINNQGQQQGGSITNLDQVIQAQNKLIESINSINSKLDQIQSKLDKASTSGSTSGSGIPNNSNNIPGSYNNGVNQGSGDFNEVNRKLSLVYDLVKSINDQVNSLKTSDNKEFETVKSSITQLATNVGKILQNSHVDRAGFMAKIDSLVSRLTYLIIPLALCGILISGYNYYKGRSPTAKKFL